MRQEWTQRVVVPVKFAIKKNKGNERILLPTTPDVKKLAAGIKQILKETTEKFIEEKSAELYRQLQKVTLAQTITFNRKRGSEVASARIVDFLKGTDTTDSMSCEVYMSMPEKLRKIAQEHLLMVVNGKCNKNNFTVLDPPLWKAYQLLLENRPVGNLSANYPHIFALSVRDDSYMSSSAVMKTFVELLLVRSGSTLRRSFR